ncbi:MAG: DUF885 domain-containing protein [Deltaproteobacteria bacterium]|nr:MAG: DUF885 domain-containing protein [Deltaproteobacteria bacterium]TMA75313.1 MAG: DUF885 domain-containing protein [Deltaproteobacteria bacterium]TMB41833.1 MAG: DUF885 domain-containing protein [Deltaproteobacteria bacterium]
MRWHIAATVLFLGCSHAAPAPPPAAQRSANGDWIERSNRNAQVLLDVRARFTPELAARTGVVGIDERISDFTPGHRERLRQALREAVSTLEGRRGGERDVNVVQDLAILVDAAERQLNGSELQEKLEVPYANVPRLVFGSVRGLLDPQVAPERRPAALARVRKYAGIEQGYRPVVELAEAETREGFRKGLLPPSRIEVENDLNTSQFLIDGIDKLFAEYRIAGAEQPVTTLHRQLEDYLSFVRSEVLPKAREDFRLPRELYEFQLQQVGVDIPGEELAQRAHRGFEQIQAEMQKVAARVAQQRGLVSGDYREVIKELKKTQIPDDQLLEFYKKRLARIEEIIRQHHLVTLPARPARIRLGTPAENAQQPAPHMSPPRLIGNTGEQGEFVLPLSVPGKVEQKYDDFNYDAAAWTLTAHEARPGHELQFASMVERGVSLARAIFAFNSVNVEGWGLYAEAITLPYMPDDGKLVSLQLRLQRAARAFVDPELQMGKWTPDSARQFLMKEVGLSPAFATSEVDRYTFRSPAQATAYYYGYLRLLEVRDAAEKQVGSRFDPLTFHDTILAQGLLPPDLMKRAVLAQLQ